MKKKILILDDEELIIRTLARLLEKTGYEVMVAKKGEDAIAITEEEDFDLMIADIRMPGVNGLEAVKKIYQNEVQKGIKKMPVIFITGYADKDQEEAAVQLKPIDYIYKPFELSELMQRIKEALKS